MSSKDTPSTFSFDNKTYNFSVKGTADSWKAFDKDSTTSAILWQYEGGGGGGGYWQIITDSPIMLYQINLNHNFSSSWGYAFTLYYYDGTNWISLGNKTLNTSNSSFFIGKNVYGLKCQYSSAAPANFNLYNIELLLLPSQYTPVNHTGTYIDDYNGPLISHNQNSGFHLDENIPGNTNSKNNTGNIILEEIFGTKSINNFIGLCLPQPIIGYRNKRNILGIILDDNCFGNKNISSFSCYNLEDIMIGQRHSLSSGYILEDDITPEHIIKNYGYVFIM